MVTAVGHGVALRAEQTGPAGRIPAGFWVFISELAGRRGVFVRGYQATRTERHRNRCAVVTIKARGGLPTCPSR